MVNLTFFLRDHLGYGDEQVLPLLSGLSETSSEPARALAKVAGAIRADEDLKNALLAARPETVAAVLQEKSPALATAVRRLRRPLRLPRAALRARRANA